MLTAKLTALVLGLLALGLFIIVKVVEFYFLGGKAREAQRRRERDEERSL